MTWTLLPERRKHRFDDATDPFDVLVVANHVTFEIDEELVLLRVIGEPLLERHTQQVVAQSHRLGREYAPIHEAGSRRMIGLKLHLRQNFALDVDAGSNFDQLQAVLGQLEHTAFGHVEHRLAALHRVVAGERPVLDLTNELVHACHH